jgi:hypothetical protein
MTTLRHPLSNPGLIAGVVIAVAGVATMIFGALYVGVGTTVTGLLITGVSSALNAD